LFNEFRKLRHERRLFPEVDLIVPSHDFLERFRRAGFPVDKLHLVHHFIEYRDALPLDDDFGCLRFLYAGRLEPNKGLGWLLESFAELPRSARLDVAGSGTAEQLFRSQVSHLGLTDQVAFHGWVSQLKLRDLLRFCHAVVIPTLGPETFGLMAAEAASFGRAVIASDSGGLRDIVEHGVTGYLVEPGRRGALAEHMKRFIENPMLAVSMGDNGHIRASSLFGLDNHLQKLEDVYAKAIARWRS
jgi:glycosyltransferase involved in cell wall biosynthesis